MSARILDPAGPLAEGAVQLAPAAPALVDGRIGVLDNAKPNARLLLETAAGAWSVAWRGTGGGGIVS